MAVRDGIMRMTHARERTSGWPNDWICERTQISRIEMQPGKFNAVALERNLVMRQRDRLSARNGFGIR
jgi:hypothetical protein